MKTIFYASGPQFKRNFTLDSSGSLRNVDLFGLMCLLLNIDPCPPSNGSLDRIQPFLGDRTTVTHLSDIILYSIGVGVILLLAMLFSIASCRAIWKQRVPTPRTHSAYAFSPIGNSNVTSMREPEND